jgi:hypothetical protein
MADPLYTGYSYGDVNTDIDSYMNEGQTTTNYGATHVVSLGHIVVADKGAYSGRLHPIWHWDISSAVPSGSYLLGGELILEVQAVWNSPENFYYWFIVVEDENSQNGADAWVEGEVTWQIAHTGHNWNTGGGDIESNELRIDVDDSPAGVGTWTVHENLEPAGPIGTPHLSEMIAHCHAHRSDEVDILAGQYEPGPPTFDGSYYDIESVDKPSGTEAILRIRYAPAETAQVFC